MTARIMVLAAVAFSLGLGGCSSKDSDVTGAAGASSTQNAITPGAGIGDVQLGMRYADLVKVCGELKDPTVSARFVIGSYKDRGLDVILTSSEEFVVSSDAILIAVGATGQGFSGAIRPGMSRSDIEARLGKAPMKVEAIEYYPDGISVKYESDLAASVGVYPSYKHAPTPPEMQAAQTSQGGT